MLSRLVGYGAHLVRQTLRSDDEHATVAEAAAQVHAEQRARIAESAETVTSAQRKHDAALRDAAEKIVSASERERTAASKVALAEARVRRMISPELGALLAELRVALDRAGHETPRAFEQTERMGRGAAWPNMSSCVLTSRRATGRSRGSEPRSVRRRRWCSRRWDRTRCTPRWPRSTPAPA